MPIAPEPDYRPPVWLRNGHVHTVVGARLRKVPRPPFERERIRTPDGDFLDLDWWRSGSDRLAVISHGLEGSTERCYVRGMSRALAGDGWDVLAWNYRGCSGEPNRLLRFYHSGATDDLHTVVSHAIAGRERVALIGFSLGGNLTLKYLGERPAHPAIRKAVAISAPCDLADGSAQLGRWSNRPYMRRFLASLHEKVRVKMAAFPDRIDDADFDQIRDFRGFDDRYTAPIHGFRDAEDYWARCSGRRFIAGIGVPTLILNALDDPFLAGACYPREECAASGAVTLEVPRFGGHVGFVAPGGRYWSEARVLAFIGD